MTKKTTLTQFVQEQIERFGIEETPKTINKIRIKCTRVLKDLKIWDNADTQLIGRKQTKVFDRKQLEILYREIEPYLLNLSNIDLDDYNEYLTKHKEYMDKILEGNYDDNIDDEQYMAPRVSKEEMRDVMLEALFALYYKPIDIQQWEADKALTFFTDPDDADNVDYYQAVKRLTDPTKYYTTRKQ